MCIKFNVYKINILRYWYTSYYSKTLYVHYLVRNPSCRYGIHDYHRLKHKNDTECTVLELNEGFKCLNNVMPNWKWAACQYRLVLGGIKLGKRKNVNLQL